MSEKSETEFIERFEPHPLVKRVARELYRAENPSGMHTNGPTMVRLDASVVHYLLSRFAKYKK